MTAVIALAITMGWSCLVVVEVKWLSSQISIEFPISLPSYGWLISLKAGLNVCSNVFCLLVFMLFCVR